MDPDVPGAIVGGGASDIAANGQTSAPNLSVIDEVVDNQAFAEQDETNKEKETTTATDQSLDGAEGDASTQRLETKDANKSDDCAVDDESAATNSQEENGQQIDVELTLDAASLDPAAIEASDVVSMEAIGDKNDQHESEVVSMEAIDNHSDQQEDDVVPLEAIDDKNDQQGDDVKAMDDKDDQQGDDVKAMDDKDDQQENDTADKKDRADEGNGEEASQSVEASDTSESLGMNGKATVGMQQNSSMENVLVDEPAVDTATADIAESSLASKGTNAASSDGQGETDVLVENVAGGASPPPTHNESEYEPSAPPALMSSVPHGDDEYDPANPSPVETPVASNAATGFASHRPAAEQEEYDPDHPFMTLAAPDEPVAMEVDPTAASIAGGELSTLTPAKRKTDDETNPASDTPANGNTDSKRPRFVDGNKSPRGDNHKHDRHRRGSGDSTLSTSSKQKHHEEDHKGLCAAAWDRLMDFQTSGEFRVTQVSRAAFASVGAMPEFAQIIIIARFVRTPMQDIRDKNGQLMRIFREYQKENPQIAVLQPVDAFISDYKSDPGLFRFGYAPPQPATGISNVQVPYQRDQPPKDLPAKKSFREAVVRSEPDQHKDVDEFGRAVHVDKGTEHESVRSTNQRSAVDPRLSSRSRQGLSSLPTQAVPPAATGESAEVPRHRDQPHSQSGTGAGRDPRRRGLSTSQQPSPRGVLPGASRVPGSSDLYERLPAPVKAVVNSMRHEGRLQEPLNDNVVTRLLHLPERVALQAVENFSNVDLSQVENLQGFLVGIINRVNEKAIASEKQHRSQVASPRGHPSAIPLGGNYGAPLQGGSVLGGPPQGGRLNSNNVANGGGYRGQPAPMATGPVPALYERPYDAHQDTRDPRRRLAAPQGSPQYGGAVERPPPAGTGHGPIGMQSFAVLPVSVQNHVHSLVANRTLASLEELGGKCYEVLGQLSEPLANQVLTRFAGANLSNVRNKSGFLIGVVKRARQEYGFD